MSRYFNKSLLGLLLLAVICTSCTKPMSTQSTSLPSPAVDLPLELNSTWVYQATRYTGFNPSEIMTATHIVTETIVDLQITSTHLAAKVYREGSAEEPVYVPESMQNVSVYPANPSKYRLVFSDNHVYRQEGNLDLHGLYNTGTLEFVFPLQLGEKWYLTNAMAELNPDKRVDSMLRKVVQVGTVTVPAGSFEDCFLLAEVIGGTTYEKWFCPGVGLVDQRSDHHGTPYGSREVLVRYDLGR